MRTRCQHRPEHAVGAQRAAKARTALKTCFSGFSLEWLINKGQLFLPAGQEGTEGGPSRAGTALRANAVPVNMASFIRASKRITKVDTVSLSPVACWLVSKGRGKGQEFLLATFAA